MFRNKRILFHLFIYLLQHYLQVVLKIINNESSELCPLQHKNIYKFIKFFNRRHNEFLEEKSA